MSKEISVETRGYIIALAPLVGFAAHLFLFHALGSGFTELLGIFALFAVLPALIDQKFLTEKGFRPKCPWFVVPLYLFERAKKFGHHGVYPLLWISTVAAAAYIYLRHY